MDWEAVLSWDCHLNHTLGVETATAAGYKEVPKGSPDSGGREADVALAVGVGHIILEHSMQGEVLWSSLESLPTTVVRSLYK